MARAALILVVLASSGCGLRQWLQNGLKVGPNYCRPLAPVADDWIDYRDDHVNTDAAHLDRWWEVFGDETLNALIEEAARQNLSLQVAGARILEARAQRGIAAGNLFPQFQEAFASYTRSKVSQRTAFPSPDAWFDQYDAGFNLSWELDFWGRYRRAIEAQDAALDASIENYDDVLVILLADVATAYVQYRTFAERIAYAEQNVTTQQRAFNLENEKFRAGADNERNMQQAKTVLAQTQAIIPVLEQGQREANNALCVLLGMPPRDLAAILGKSAKIPVAPPEIVVGVPADLVRRRPDVRRAEREVAAQSARIGIAQADFYPRVLVVGTLGASAERGTDLFDTPESMTGTIGPAVRWDILNYGRIVNGVRVEDARWRQAAFAYQETVLQAAREAENGIVAFIKAREQRDRLEESVKAAQRTVDITEAQVREGDRDYTFLFIFQVTLTEQQDLLAVARGNIALGLIRTYRALGGGWEIRLAPAEGGGLVRELPPLPKEVPAEAPVAPEPR